MRFRKSYFKLYNPLFKAGYLKYIKKVIPNEGKLDFFTF